MTIKNFALRDYYGSVKGNGSTLLMEKCREYWGRCECAYVEYLSTESGVYNTLTVRRDRK